MKKNKSNEGNGKKYLNGANAFAFMLVMIVIFTAHDLIRDIMIDSSAYEVRFENDETYATQGRIYRLYVEGQEYGDIDYNRFSITDENGNTDYKYCQLIEDASRLTYTLILSAMLYIVVIIARNSIGSTPFTTENSRLIRVIAGLQLSLCFLPGMVRLIMSFIRFDYYSSSFDIGSLYMFAIAFVISMIAYVFEKGRALQEDVDSIA
ncbi:MAG: DUF2975 domain-containing protein [Lachnospiraceae bacterium]|nr:DUF2975 domain-containing protein [Lachnospiraceae bacterium]